MKTRTLRALLLTAPLAVTACLDSDGGGGALDGTTVTGADDAATSTSATGAPDAASADDTGTTSPTTSADTDATSPDDTTTTAAPDATVASDAASTTAVADTSTPDDTAEPLPHFSFFVTSLKALQELSGSELGFGGDLTYGETGPGAGLRGADKLCAIIAERSMPGASVKQWRAFLSAVDGGDGQPVHAIDRIGEGPWYDRLGRVFAEAKADLLADRPTSADAAIKNDFPNEDGVPNHRPDPTQPAVDNHDMLTGSDDNGELYSDTATCDSWTGATGTEGRPRVGHSWPRSGGPGGGGGGGPGGDMDPANWMSSLNESGCAPGVNLVEMGGPLPGSNTVGSGGGYGGFYCFALTP